jgi:hypothetical protein
MNLQEGSIDRLATVFGPIPSFLLGQVFRNLFSSKDESEFVIAKEVKALFDGLKVELVENMSAKIKLNGVPLGEDEEH